VKTYKLKKQEVQVIADATDPNIANTITNYVNAILQNRARNKQSKPASLSNTNPNSIVLQRN
jgi:ABC-2 type transport system permease protein